jgi:predicted small metal-binding protein
MLEFSCREAGAHCKAHVTARDSGELERVIEQHLKDVHGAEPNETLVTYLLSTARETRGGAS